MTLVTTVIVKKEPNPWIENFGNDTGKTKVGNTHCWFLLGCIFGFAYKVLSCIGYLLYYLCKCCCKGMFESNHPTEERYFDDGRLLCVVPADSVDKCVFDSSIQSLKVRGTSTPASLTLSSHPNLAIVPIASTVSAEGDRSEKGHLQHHGLGLGPSDIAIRVTLKDGFLQRHSTYPAAGGSILKMFYFGAPIREQHPVYCIRYADDPDDKLKNQKVDRMYKVTGTKFQINDDNTISPLDEPTQVLGVSKPRLVLVKRDSPRILNFEHAEALQDDADAPTTTYPLTLKSHPDYAVIFTHQGMKKFEGFEYVELGVDLATNTTTLVTVLVQGKQLVAFHAGQKVAINARLVVDNGTINGVANIVSDTPSIHSSFTIQSNGTIKIDSDNLYLGTNCDLFPSYATKVPASLVNDPIAQAQAKPSVNDTAVKSVLHETAADKV